ncbi:phosphotransferase [Paenibacillus sp. RC67]|uniref:phosphotransferase enzyme family protein n=1 Tax=Paenibacillus sp. RC67 TaxID=3039392 RepID=UPI0024ADD1D7|nr:phosphotransferase [Paenibacillus sp. RC67]
MISEEVLTEVLSQLQCPPSCAELLGGYNDNVFEVGREEKIVVKIMESSVYSYASQRAELEWLDYLHAQGVKVVKPLRLKSGNYIQPISNDFYFITFEKINGLHPSPRDKDVWGPTLFELWGEAMGKIHTAAKNYVPTSNHPHWYQNSLLLQIHSIQLDPLIMKKWNSYDKQLKKLPRTKDYYGLIHGDLHHGNFLITGNDLTIIDFADSEHHWFAYDVAIAIYHTAHTVPKLDRKEFVKGFVYSFMNGYTRANSNTTFLSQIDDFINYRHLFSYTYHTLNADKSQLTEQQHEYLHEMELSLLTKSSYLGFSVI